MSRIQILSDQEREAFDSPLVFNSAERRQFFELPPKVESMVDSMRTPINAVCLVVILGSFKATKRFFGLQVRDEDVQYVAEKLGYFPEILDKDDYDKTTVGRHRKLILDYQGYNSFDDSAQ